MRTATCIKAETAHALDGNDMDQDSFSEIVILLGKYDLGLKEHVSVCIQKSKLALVTVF